ncbi:hypothetical protein HXX76_005750 [Chlamydomonas incerta]|uniref:DNA 5'-3' helicase n=1 Tax=Chlamydomonas incerta TaxID=51695 RepID=A0A835TH28_CHLIN|nr:hypothetical protein HXX76_005750 [Chlamydomonas incerta]|eukprot:KAG2438141.1 hypothetical protein HXX76_005750 [Chlamydomonas incerta]
MGWVASTSSQPLRGTPSCANCISRDQKSATAKEGSRESVDAGCRRLTATWVRERAAERRGSRPGGAGGGDVEMEDAAAAGPSGSAAGGAAGGGDGAARGGGGGDVADIELCEFYEGHERAGVEALLPPGVYTLADLRAFGRKQRWCPYFLARHMMAFANVVVYSYQYMIDPKVSQMVSRELEKECVVVFDEAHNIDNVCIEALSVNLRKQTLEAAGRNLGKLNASIRRAREADAQRLQSEYNRLVQGLVAQGALRGGEDWLANPALPEDVVAETVPGNIRRAEHFVGFLARFLAFLRDKMSVPVVTSQTPEVFLTELQERVQVDAKTLKFCYDRLSSLLKTLEITNTDEFTPIQLVADFATLVGTYAKGFAIIMEPYDERLPQVPDPVLQLSCLDASLAMRPVFSKFQTVVITSGTLSPIDLYPRILNFNPVAIQSFQMTLTRECLCPVVVTRGADQMPLSTKFEMRSDPGVMRNYGRLLVDLSATVPDGIVAFFVSYRYMDQIISKWHDMGILQEIMQHKLIFIETQDVVETTLALDNFRRACDSGRGAVFLSVARGKVAEGIDFDRHYGRAVVMFGVPYQYTLSRILRARLEYLRETFQIKEADYLAFDAVRQAAQCVGRVIRSKADYGMMIFADKRYQRHDKRDKLPQWITRHLREAHMNLSTDMMVHVAREFLRSMAQPYDRGAVGKSLLSEAALAALEAAGGMEGAAAAAAAAPAAAPALGP